MTYQCPVCGGPVDPIPRHPRLVCATCSGRATSADGRPLEFFNLDLSGGYGSRYRDDGSPYDSHDCFIEGRACRADEGYLGGIIIELAEPHTDWSGLSDRQLLATYCALMRTLKDRGIVRSSNNPVADYTESLVSRALGLALAGQSQAGYDALDAQGVRYQIKGRRLSTRTTSPQLGAIRNLAAKPFDLLAAVAFDANLVVLYAGLIPVDTVAAMSRYTGHTNSHILIFRKAVLEDPAVRDITAQLRAAQSEPRTTEAPSLRKIRAIPPTPQSSLGLPP